MVSNNHTVGSDLRTKGVFQVFKRGLASWGEKMLSEESLDRGQSRVVWMIREMQEAAFLVKPGVQDGRVVNAGQSVLEDWAKLRGCITTFAEAKE